MASRKQFVAAAMNHAQFEQMESGEWFASIAGLGGLWAKGTSRGAARKDLLGALDGWIEVTIKAGNRIPAVGGVRLSEDLREVADD